MAVENSLIVGNVEVADLQRLVPVIIQRTVSGTTEKKSSGSVGVLAGANIGDTVTDNAGGTNWTVANRVDINPMSKYKPVRFNKIRPLSESEFSSIRYGLRPKGTGGAYATFSSSLINPNVAWIYDKPRGGAYNEPYRITDFYHYFHRASPPFLFEVSGQLGSSVGVTFYRDALAADIYNQGQDAAGSWSPDYNISMADLFNGYQTPSNSSYLCVCVHDVTDNTYLGVVVFNKTVGSIESSATPLIMFAEQTIQSGVTYPAVPFINDLTKSGHTFRFIAGLRNSYSGGTAPYEVYNGGSGIDIYPLAFKQGIDRKDVVLYSNITIQGLQCWFDNPAQNISATYLGTATYAGRTMDKYLVTGNLYGIFITPNNWNTYEVPGVTVKMVLRTQGYVGDNDLYSVGMPVSLPDAGKFYEKQIVEFGASAKAIYLYIEPSADTRTIEFVGISEYAYEQVDFQSTFVVKIPKGY